MSLSEDPDRSLTAEKLLDQMLADMRRAPSLYRPTNFWASGLDDVVHDLRRLGVNSFRRHPSALFFYVPTYRPTQRAWLQRLLRIIERVLVQTDRGVGLRRVLTGQAEALSAYRLIHGHDAPGFPNLLSVSESDFGQPTEQFEFEGRRYSRSSLNYLRGLAYFKRIVPNAEIRTVLEIGGGFGTLGELLIQSDDVTYIDVDIPPVAFVATTYLRYILGESVILGYDTTRTVEEIDIADLRRDGKSAVLMPWQLPILKGSVDLFVNFISFQEMEPDIVRNYARHVDRLRPRYLLLRNQVAGKHRAQEGSVGVLSPVTRATYLQVFDQYELLGQDSVIYGEDLGPTKSRSEVLVLRRREI